MVALSLILIIKKFLYHYFPPKLFLEAQSFFCSYLIWSVFVVVGYFIIINLVHGHFLSFCMFTFVRMVLSIWEEVNFVFLTNLLTIDLPLTIPD